VKRSNSGFGDLTELFESVVACIGEHTPGGLGQPGREVAVRDHAVPEVRGLARLQNPQRP
jgi:hypothetical protein